MSQPGVIDGLQFARGGSEIHGTLLPERFQRLAQMHCRVGEVAYSVRGGANAKGKPCLRVRAGATLELTCQRCLEALRQAVEVDAELELSESPQEMAQAEDDTDRVLATASMDVAQLVEDELILALPDAPKHEDCEVPVEGLERSRVSPFDALARLKGRVKEE
jgi:uncharacterized protein